MKNLSLTLTELVTLIKFLGGITAAITVVAFLVQLNFMSASILGAVWTSLSGALTFTTIIFGLFYKWAWRNPTIARYVNRPVLHGVWIGNLSSDYRNEKDGRDKTDTELPPKIPIVFVVRQTYLTLSIVSYTKQQDGESHLEAIIHNHDSDTVRLKYLYELKKPYKGASRLVVGAGDLKLVNNGETLEGEYWTSNPTYGTLTLKRVSPDCSKIKSFNDAGEMWHQLESNG